MYEWIPIDKTTTSEVSLITTLGTEWVASYLEAFLTAKGREGASRTAANLISRIWLSGMLAASSYGSQFTAGGQALSLTHSLTHSLSPSIMWNNQEDNRAGRIDAIHPSIIHPSTYTDSTNHSQPARQAGRHIQWHWQERKKGLPRKQWVRIN